MERKLKTSHTTRFNWWTYSSRKFLMALLAMLLVTIVSLFGGKWAGIAGILPIFIGGILGILSIYLTGNVANKYVISKYMECDPPVVRPAPITTTTTTPTSTTTVTATGENNEENTAED